MTRQLIAPFSISAMFLLALGTPNLAQAGCSINIELKNDENVRVLYVQLGSDVKSKGGSWKKLVRSQQHIETGKTISFVQNGTFGCKAKRRYRVRFVKEGHRWIEYYPSATGWTTKTNIKIVARQ